MPKVSDKYKTERRHHLIEISGRRIASVGFQKTTMMDVIDASGMSPGAVYAYFASKQELLTAVMDDVLRQLDAAFQETSKCSTSTAVGMVSTSLLKLDELEEGRPGTTKLVMHLWAEAMHDAHLRALLRDVVHVARTRLSDAIGQAQEHGTMDDTVVPGAVTDVVLGLVIGFVTQSCLLADVMSSGYTAGVHALTGPVGTR